MSSNSRRFLFIFQFGKLVIMFSKQPKIRITQNTAAFILHSLDANNSRIREAHSAEQRKV
jgi:hypothetical protein